MEKTGNGIPSFKIFKPKDYCEDSNVYMLIKDSVLEAWESTNVYFHSGQTRRIRYKILSPKTKISDILLYATSNSNQKRYFLDHLNSLLRTYFPTARFKDWINNPDGFEIKESTTLLNLYNLLKNVPINNVIKIETHSTWVDEIAKKYYD